MRPRFLAPLLISAALLVAAPGAMAHGDTPPPAGPETATSTETADASTRARYLLRAADRFDRRAGTMRTRADRLRATALELRQEAEDLFADGDPGAAAFSEQPEPAGPPPAGEGDAGDEPGTGPCDPAQDEDGAEDSARRGDQPMPPAEADPATAGPSDDACELLRLADRLEDRAGDLYVAADRMQLHAAKLREKAQSLLGSNGNASAEQLLEKAAKLRATAAQLRARADTLRETAFDDTDVDDAIVEQVQRLELRAAGLDRRADRLEARAASSVA